MAEVFLVTGATSGIGAVAPPPLIDRHPARIRSRRPDHALRDRLIRQIPKASVNAWRVSATRTSKTSAVGRTAVTRPTDCDAGVVIHSSIS